MSVVSIVLAVLAVGFLIVVHEGGHYFVARWCGMRIDRFSIGFGPGILKRTSAKTGTTFQIAPIPFGGFVEIRGMNVAEDVDPEDRYSYPNRPTWQRIITIFAGPATNYLSAIALGLVLFTCRGIDDPAHVVVVEARPGHDAYVKLRPGDRIRAVNHETQYLDHLNPSLAARVNATDGAPLTLTIERDGVQSEVVVQPLLAFPHMRGPYRALRELRAAIPVNDKGEMDRKHRDALAVLRLWIDPPWRIGIVQQSDVVEVGLGEAVQYAFEYPVVQTRFIATMLHSIVIGAEEAEVGGPVRMVSEFQNAFSRSGWEGIRLLMALSVYLGLFNLLPLPALDGGRLVFLIYELVTRRRANPKIEAIVHMVGIMALGVLMLFVLVADFRDLIARLF